MRQVWISRTGPPEVLKLRESRDPNPSAGQIRIRVRAAGVNFADLMARVGLYPDAPKIPCVVGYEVSGVVDAIGDGVTSFAIGDRVFALTNYGGYTDTLVVDSHRAFRMPTSMSFEDGAAFPVASLTAHHMMLYSGELRANSSVLIHSAAGGVGLAAVQLAKTRSCRIFGIASKSKHAFLREQGCQYPIDTDTDYVRKIRELTGGRGVDLILDPRGGKSWTEAYELLALGGRLVAFGCSAVISGKRRNLLHAVKQLGRVQRWSPMQLLNDNKSIQGVSMGPVIKDFRSVPEQFAALIAMYEQGQIKPHIDRTFAFREAALAHHCLHDRSTKGKVLLIPE